MTQEAKRLRRVFKGLFDVVLLLNGPWLGAAAPTQLLKHQLEMQGMEMNSSLFHLRLFV